MTWTMKTARELYGAKMTGDTWYEGPFDYSPIVQSLGYVVVKVDDKDYQGDTRALLERNGKFGLLVFGWGSCSGCDALQGCGSYEEVDELIQKLNASITWFDTLQECVAYISHSDRLGSHYAHSAEWLEFVKQCSDVVNGEVQ